MCTQLVNARTVEAYTAKLEQKRVEFVKLKDENATLKASVAELTSQLAKSRLEFAQLDADSKAAAARAAQRAETDRECIRGLEASKTSLARQLDSFVWFLCV